MKITHKEKSIIIKAEDVPDCFTIRKFYYHFLNNIELIELIEIKKEGEFSLLEIPDTSLLKLLMNDFIAFQKK